MANYSERLIITVPDTLADIAAKIGKALDPDVGGENSFTDNGDGTITANTPCTPEFKAQADFLMTDAATLHQAISANFAERWPEMTAPTLSECQAFIAGIVVPQPI